MKIVPVLRPRESGSDCKFVAVVQFVDDVRDAYTIKTAEKIAAEGNC